MAVGAYLFLNIEPKKILKTFLCRVVECKQISIQFVVKFWRENSNPNRNVLRFARFSNIVYDATRKNASPRETIFLWPLGGTREYRSHVFSIDTCKTRTSTAHNRLIRVAKSTFIKFIWSILVCEMNDNELRL